MQKIVGGVVRQCDLVAKIKIAKFFPWHVAKIYARENFPLYGIFGCDFVLFHDPTHEEGIW